MTLLSPMFLLAGVLLASIPVVIHLLNRRRFREQRWAAMEFLLRAMRKNRRRLRFEQWLLLAVRCLLLALLGLALARPVGCGGGGAGALAGARSAGLHVIVIDDSYSMLYRADRTAPDGSLLATHLDAARGLARQAIDRLTPGGDAVEIITASKPARVLFPTGYDLDAARAAVGRITPTAASTDLAGALELAARTGREATGRFPVRTLRVISDATRSSVGAVPAAAEGVRAGDARAGSVAGGVAGDGAAGGSVAVAGPAGGAGGGVTAASKDAAGVFDSFVFHSMGLTDQRHAAVVELGPVSRLLTARQAGEFRAVARGYGAEVMRSPRWRLDESVLPGSAGDVRLTEAGEPLVAGGVRFGRAGARVVSVSLSGGGATDARLSVDATRRRVVEVDDRVRVLIVEGDRGGSGAGSVGGSGAFLRLALAPPSAGGTGLGAGRSNSPLEPEAVSDLELPSKVLGDYRVVALAGVPRVNDAAAEQLRAFVDGGGTLLLFPGEGIETEAWNRTLGTRGLLPGILGTRADAPADGRGFTLDFNPEGNLHPLLSVFRGERRSGLDTASVFTFVRAEVGSPGVERVLEFTAPAGQAKFPAITTHKLGSGRVLFVATSAGADGWTSLPAKPVFVTLVHELIAGSLTARDTWLNLTVGDRLTLPSGLALAGTPTLTDPDGRAVAIAASGSTRPAVWRSDVLTVPGLYTLGNLAGRDGVASLPVAVNVDAAAEADVRTLDARALAAALGDVKVEVVGDTLPAEATAGDDRRADFGWSLLLALLAFVGIESLLAHRFGHSSVATSGSGGAR